MAFPLTNECVVARDRAPRSSRAVPRGIRVALFIAAFVGVLAVTSFVASALTAAPASAVITGIDIASHQHPNGAAINWQQVAGAGHKFAYVKATEGPGIGTEQCRGRSYYTNPYFAGDWNGAGSVGLYRGAYHYARPQSSFISG